MDRETLRELAGSIEGMDKEARRLAKERQADLAKPPGSLGGLETISIRMAGITGQVKNRIRKTCVAVFCADNGVTEEGVTSAPTTVTAAQTMNFTRRLTGVGALSQCFGSELLIVDMGVKDTIAEVLYDTSGVPLQDTHRIIDRRIRPGTWNLAKGPAMTEEEVFRCIETGIEMANAVKDAEFDILGVGEMGIGNTTTSASVLSGITGASAVEVTGRGGGVTDEGFRRKQEIVSTAVRRWREHHDQEDVISLLSEVGGFDICAMTGAYLGAALRRMPVVIDGYISVVAALAAATIAPAAANYMFASHNAFERGYRIALDAINACCDEGYATQPFLSLDMRLGEGSGCPIAFQVIRGACDVLCDMATFEEAAINDDYLEEVRKGGCF